MTINSGFSAKHVPQNAFILLFYTFFILFLNRSIVFCNETKRSGIPITLCKSRITSLWIPFPSFSKSLIWVVGVEISKKRLSTFYMLQNLEGDPLPGLPCYMFGGATCFFHHVLPKMAKAFAREITLTTLERLFSRVFAHVYI